MLMESQPQSVEAPSGIRYRAGWLRSDQVMAAGREFMRWWRGELMALVPARLRHLIAEPRLRAEASASEVRVYRPGEDALLDRVMLLGPALARPLPGALRPPGAAQGKCEVVLDRALVLESPLTLPLEAERELHRVLAFSMDRYTPFNEGDVYFDFRVTRRDLGNRKIDVVLYAAPRKVVDAIVRRLAQAELEAEAVDIAAADGVSQRLGLNLLPLVPRHTHANKTRFNIALAGCAGLLLLLVLAIPLWHRHQAMVSLEAELTRLLPQVQAAGVLQSEVDGRVERARQIHLRKSAAPAVLDVLLALTRLVPDEAWAGQVDIKEGRVRLSGEAAAASEMVQTLTASGYFSDPRFEAPLTQNPKNGRERFVISLALKGGGNER